MENIFAVYKPKGPTSHDIIDEVRKITGERTVGHAGTLDPLASGVLVIGVGREATRKLSTIVAKEKEYIADIMLGETSATDDAEGAKTPHKDNFQFSIPNFQTVEAALEKFRGVIMQAPPAYSALKIKGKPAHRRVRQGETVELEPREVTIKNIDLISYEWPRVRLRVVTGPGVYIRALARDLGAALSTGGYLAELERTRVGEYAIQQALPLSELAKKSYNKKQTNMISFDHFKQLDLRVAKIKEASRVEGSEKLIKLIVEDGEGTTRQIVAGIGKAYEPEALLGTEIVIIANLEPRSLMGQESNGMLLAANVDGMPVLLAPREDVPPGTSIT